ncbi:MAG: heme exporter protein CcmD [Bauldia sp.]|nr:heme exporter protein CcmD [Bauldia sp.]
MDLGDHAGFIIGGYLASFVVIVGLIVFSINQSRKVRARLAELEARGVRRRSDARSAGRAAPEAKV